MINMEAFSKFDIKSDIKFDISIEPTMWIGHKVRNIWFFHLFFSEKNIIVNFIIQKWKSKNTSLKKYTNLTKVIYIFVLF